jgi:hypothetical protein
MSFPQAVLDRPDRAGVRAVGKVRGGCEVRSLGRSNLVLPSEEEIASQKTLAMTILRNDHPSRG